jgi:rhodanese-related sulfurtransferase
VGWRPLLGCNAFLADRAAKNWTMPIEIDREEVRTMAAGGAQLIDVLPSKQYEEERLPGAINIPLKKLDGQAVAALDRNRPVIVYCYEYQ